MTSEIIDLVAYHLQRDECNFSVPRRLLLGENTPLVQQSVFVPTNRFYEEYDCPCGNGSARIVRIGSPGNYRYEASCDHGGAMEDLEVDAADVELMSFDVTAYRKMPDFAALVEKSIKDHRSCNTSGNSLSSYDVIDIKEGIKNLATKEDVSCAVKSVNANIDKQFRNLRLWLTRLLDETIRFVKYLFGIFQKKIKPTTDNVDAAANYRYAHLENLSEQHREQVCAIIDYSHDVQPITYNKSRATKYKAGISFWDVANILISKHPEWKASKLYYDAAHLADACQKMADRPERNRVNFRYANPQN